MYFCCMKKSILLLIVLFVSSCSLLKKQPKEESSDNFDTEVRATFHVNRPIEEDTTLYNLMYYKYGNDTIHIYEETNSTPKSRGEFELIRVDYNVRMKPWP